MSADKTDAEPQEGAQGFQAVPAVARVDLVGSRVLQAVSPATCWPMAHCSWPPANGLVPKILLTPKNAMKLTRQLAEMRGAAMSWVRFSPWIQAIYQRVDGYFGNVARQGLRHARCQLEEVLIEGLGTDYADKLRHFEREPFAAASIGQVHRLRTRDGRAAVLKSVPGYP